MVAWSVRGVLMLRGNVNGYVNLAIIILCFVTVFINK